MVIPCVTEWDWRYSNVSKKRNYEAEQQNHATYYMYYNRLKDYALSMFEWDGLPDSVSERYLEIVMYRDGRTVFFKDPELGFMTLPVTIGSTINAYEDPTGYVAYSVNYPQRNLTPDEAVVIYNSYSRTAMMPIIEQFARRLAHVERAMDVNIQATKTPVLILADESQRLTMLNAYMQYNGNEPFIFGNKSGFDKDAFKVLKTDAPLYTDKLMQYRHDLWNNAMTFLGIGNAKQDKRERLVSDEVAANDEQIQSSRFVWLQARQDACMKINNMFGLNLSVDFKLNKAAIPEIDEIEEPGNNNPIDERGK
jgi:hypothetical protein